MDNLGFQKITIIQIEYINNVQQILVITFEFTGAACVFMIMSCAARVVKKVGQHWYRVRHNSYIYCSADAHAREQGINYKNGALV